MPTVKTFGRELAKMGADVDGRGAMGERDAATTETAAIMTARAAGLAIAALAVAALTAPCAMASPAIAQDAGGYGGRHDAGTVVAQADSRRPRTRIRISPRCFYRTESVPFPVPYACESPGPGYVRECSSWLVQEMRPSGPVITPQMRCWWVRD